MNKKRYGPYSLISIMILLIGIIPAFGEAGNPDSKSVLSFVDPNKDPKYYVDRYYDEPKYRAWFDRNYPNLTIEEAVGYVSEKQDMLSNKLLPKAEALSSTTNSTADNRELSQIVLAVAALATLFGATYGIKRKVDDNSRQISINRDKIRQKIIKPIIGSNPLDILQARLAKGEISINEYYKIKKELD